VKGGVKRIGSEKVRGTRTTHYRVTIDADQAVNSAPEARRDEVRNSIGALGSKKVPADVWIDSKGRLRKVRLHVAGSSTTSKGSVSFEFFDLGAQVSVDAPSADEVIDFQDLLGGSTTGPSGGTGG
ncbi:MAG TPA: LppX_LprAFG lipoprotein, partial [Acidimicrobiia bacterium]